MTGAMGLLVFMHGLAFFIFLENAHSMSGSVEQLKKKERRTEIKITKLHECRSTGCPCAATIRQKSTAEIQEDRKMRENNNEQYYKKMERLLMGLKPEEVEITFMKINKLNRVGLHGCILRMPGADAAPTFYLEDFVEAYENGTSAEDIAQSIIKCAMDISPNAVPGGIDINDYESVKTHLGLMVIGEERNRELLGEYVHEKTEDLAVMPAIYIQDDQRSGRIRIKKELLDAWGVTERTVMDDAIANAPRIMPPIMKNLCEFAGAQSKLPAFMVSNQYCSDGASVAFYPGFLNYIKACLGMDLYILPSSINELVIIADYGQDPKELLQLVRMVNRTEVDPEEVLTDSVYRYKDGKICKVA